MDNKAWAPGREGNYPLESQLYTLFPQSKPKPPSERLLVGPTLGQGPGLLNQFWIQKATDDSVGVFWLFLIVSGYLLFIGPLDWAITKRLKKPAFTWILFIGAILGFSFLAYAYTSLVNIGEMRAVHVQVLDASPHGGLARGSGSYWLYSAKNATYSIESPKKDLIFSGHESTKSVGKLAFVDIQNGTTSSIETRIPIFSHKYFETAWTEPWPHKVTYKKVDKVRTLTLPEDITASHVYIVDASGYRSLTKQQNNAWTARGSHTANWTKLNTQVEDFQAYQDWGGGWGGYQENHQHTLPRADALRAYLTQVSFPYFVEDNDQHRPRIDPKIRMSGREMSLDLRHLTDAGREVALIFIDQKADPLLPMTVSGGTPRQVTACVIRMALPKE